MLFIPSIIILEKFSYISSTSCKYVTLLNFTDVKHDPPSIVFVSWRLVNDKLFTITN